MLSIGAVGFYDILGYQNLIQNNNLDKISNDIIKIILDLPNKVKEKCLKDFASLPADHQNIINEEISKISTKIFSDTIIIFFPMNETYDYQRQLYNWSIFLQYNAVLCGLAFQHGLPLRGAIDYGSFYYQESCFAGKPIIDSYKLSSTIQLACAVLTDAAFNRFQELFIKSDRTIRSYFSKLFFAHMVQFKENIEKKMLVLNWLTESGFFFDLLKVDLRLRITESFSAHNKDLPKEVYSKIENTEMFFRVALSRFGMECSRFDLTK